jgi:TFIIF-interacting CTD phosphatase-like protein
MSAATAASSNGRSDRKSRKTDILLPGGSFVLQTWKVKPGALVRVGETIGMACHKTAATAASTTASMTDTSTHRRPNRRRRLVSTAAAPGPGPGPGPDNSPTTKAATSSTTSSSILSLQQRLAEKLNSEKNSKEKESSEPQQQSIPSSSTTSPTSSSSTTTTDTTTTPAVAVVPIPIPILATATGLLRASKNSFSPLDESQRKLAIGYIEECLHPAFLDGLCVVCGTSMKDEQDFDIISATQNQNVDPTSLSQVTVSGGITMTVSHRESRQMAQQDSERLLQQGKLCLVLDLDHTLVHATSDPRASQYHNKPDVRTLRLPMMEGMPGQLQQQQQQQQQQHPGVMLWMQHHVKLRPHIKEFLENVQPDYELTVYTAGTRQYAEEITIVLCRHLVGSVRDVDDLERLRYDVQMAHVEYHKHQSLEKQNGDDPQRQPRPQPQPSANGTKGMQMEEDGEDTTQKRKADELVQGEEQINGDGDVKEPAKKRKKVSFGLPHSSTEDSTSTTPTKTITDANTITNTSANTSTSTNTNTNTNTMKSDHMTFERLHQLQQELQMAEELERKAWDLRQKVFGSRVVSRTDVGDLGRDVKSLRRIFPCGGTMAAVVDDREDVWANATDNSHDTIRGEPPDNLLLVRPYHWQPFLGFADINNSAGIDLSGTGPDSGDPEVEMDRQLLWIGRVLKNLHKRYYKQPEGNRKTVPELLAQMRGEVLQGCTLVLSGLVPLHKKTIGANSPRPSIVRYAECLGAKVSHRIVSYLMVSLSALVLCVVVSNPFFLISFFLSSVHFLLLLLVE